MDARRARVAQLFLPSADRTKQCDAPRYDVPASWRSTRTFRVLLAEKKGGTNVFRSAGRLDLASVTPSVPGRVERFMRGVVSNRTSHSWIAFPKRFLLRVETSRFRLPGGTKTSRSESCAPRVSSPPMNVESTLASTMDGKHSIDGSSRQRAVALCLHVVARSCVDSHSKSPEDREHMKTTATLGLLEHERSACNDVRGRQARRQGMEGEKDTEVGSSCWCDARELHRVRAEEVSSLLERAKTWKDEKCDQLKDAIDRCSEANTVPEDVLKVLHELKLDFDASCNTLKRLWDCLVAEDTKDIDLVEMKRQEVLRVETANRLNSILCSMKTRAWNDARSTCKKGLERAMVAHPSEESKSQKVKLLFRLGKASAKLGEFEEAREALLEALKLDPSISTSVCSELKLLERLQEKHQVAQRASYARIFDSSAEIYDKEERAPKGQAFPAYRDRDMSRGLERVNYEEEFREIDEEERMLQRSQEARSRVRAVDMTYKGNPWDPSGEKQQREIDNYYLKMFAEQDQGN